jgi:hypothetical protein
MEALVVVLPTPPLPDVTTIFSVNVKSPFLYKATNAKLAVGSSFRRKPESNLLFAVMKQDQDGFGLDQPYGC